jgi:hypothetical protein
MNKLKCTSSQGEIKAWRAFIDRIADDAARVIDELKDTCLRHGEDTTARVLFFQAMDDL